MLDQESSESIFCSMDFRDTFSWISIITSENDDLWGMRCKQRHFTEMVVLQLSSLLLHSSPSTQYSQLSRPKKLSAIASASMASLSSPSIQIVGGRSENLIWPGNGNSYFGGGDRQEMNWVELDADLVHWTNSMRPIQWYPGHIAKTEKELKEQLKLMDVVIEVRDARIPLSTTHPQMDMWLGDKSHLFQWAAWNGVNQGMSFVEFGAVDGPFCRQ